MYYLPRGYFSETKYINNHIKKKKNGEDIQNYNKFGLQLYTTTRNTFAMY